MKHRKCVSIKSFVKLPHFMPFCECARLCFSTAAKLISSDCLITQRAQEKQEVLVAMAQRECYVPTNTAQ